jgi:hypothetical protein
VDCKYFEQGDNHWFTFPSKEFTKSGDEKPSYIPLVSFVDKDYATELKKAVLIELKKATQEKGNDKTSQKEPNIPSKPPFGAEIPF